ncbi:hypothetical protein [Silvanigrella sp.]|jgi:hypothetical protein|uniref:Ppx/GppA phosphatase family protein n=1 Tax=Silvanigrella sp. TaxID=2024976 RepID=UPI0037C5EC84
MKKTKKITIVLTNLLLTSCASNIQNKIITCQSEIRGGFDIGSGSTKLQISKVRICDNDKINIEKVYYKSSIAVKYSQDLNDSNSKMFSQKIINKGMDAMKLMTIEALQKLEEECGTHCKVNAWRGIMTEAFRKAKNWEDAKTQLSTTVDGLLIKRLNQKEEALYGFYPIIKLNGFDQNNAVVWDIGGGSTQLTALDTNFKRNQFSVDGVYVIGTSLGSATFASFLKSKMDSNNSLNSFNPIHDYDFLENESELHINKKILNSVTENNYIKENFNSLFIQNKNFYVIGGLLSISIPETLSKDDQNFKVYNYSEVKNTNEICAISKKELDDKYHYLKKLNDSELLSYAIQTKSNVNFSQTIASNILMVRKYMESLLNIKEIYPIQIDGTDTLMIHPAFGNKEYWKKENVHI